jgi:hypothetical protein
MQLKVLLQGDINVLYLYYVDTTVITTFAGTGIYTAAATTDREHSGPLVRPRFPSTES